MFVGFEMAALPPECNEERKSFIRTRAICKYHKTKCSAFASSKGEDKRMQKRQIQNRLVCLLFFSLHNYRVILQQVY